jgi:catechol 2,3-dioxygenase-like lactoylglutathione lyase family enzyme
MLPDAPEVTMSSTQMMKEPDTPKPGAKAVETKLEVVVLPVSDVDRAKAFYQGLGWRLDADFTNNQDWRLVQMTPTGSACSVMFGRGFTTAAPGSVQGNFLVVDDVAAARAELIAHGAEVSELFHFGGPLRVSGTEGRLAGPDPEGQSYRSWASFNDPDGNSWMIQEIKSRLPGRGFSSLDVATMTALLKEAEDHHGEYEPTAPKHHWSDWYAAYIVAREHGRTPEDAAKDGARHMEDLRT